MISLLLTCASLSRLIILPNLGETAWHGELNKIGSEGSVEPHLTGFCSERLLCRGNVFHY